MSILTVEEDKIGERFWREGRVAEEEVQFFETARWILFNIHKGLVVKSNWI